MFELPVNDDLPQRLLNTADAIRKAGGSFQGDEQSGSFTGMTPLGTVSCNYVVSKPTVKVTITEKPFLLRASVIETEVRKYFSAILP